MPTGGSSYAHGMTDYLTEAAVLAPRITDLRHRLHRWPELGNDLPRTQAAVLAALEGLDLEVTRGVASTSVTAVLRGRAGSDAAASGRPVVLLRGDMDGLPIHEETGLAHAAAGRRPAAAPRGRHRRSHRGPDQVRDRASAPDRGRARPRLLRDPDVARPRLGQGPNEYFRPDTGGKPPRATTVFGWSAALTVDLAAAHS